MERDSSKWKADGCGVEVAERGGGRRWRTGMLLLRTLAVNNNISHIPPQRHCYGTPPFRSTNVRHAMFVLPRRIAMHVPIQPEALCHLSIPVHPHAPIPLIPPFAQPYLASPSAACNRHGACRVSP